MKEKLQQLLEKWINERQVATTREQQGYTHCINDLEKLIYEEN